jgi:hypothetical protein
MRLESGQYDMDTKAIFVDSWRKIKGFKGKYWSACFIPTLILSAQMFFPADFSIALLIWQVLSMALITGMIMFCLSYLQGVEVKAKQVYRYLHWYYLNRLLLLGLIVLAVWLLGFIVFLLVSLILGLILGLISHNLAMMSLWIFTLPALLFVIVIKQVFNFSQLVVAKTDLSALAAWKLAFAAFKTRKSKFIQFSVCSWLISILFTSPFLVSSLVVFKHFDGIPSLSDWLSQWRVLVPGFGLGTLMMIWSSPWLSMVQANAYRVIFAVEEKLDSAT